jgi:hypothetical protein
VLHVAAAELLGDLVQRGAARLRAERLPRAERDMPG